MQRISRSFSVRSFLWLLSALMLAEKMWNSYRNLAETWEKLEWKGYWKAELLMNRGNVIWLQRQWRRGEWCSLGLRACIAWMYISHFCLQSQAIIRPTYVHFYIGASSLTFLVNNSRASCVNAPCDVPFSDWIRCSSAKVTRDETRENFQRTS